MEVISLFHYLEEYSVKILPIHMHKVYVKELKENTIVPNISVEINKSNVLPFAVQELKQVIRLRNSSLLEAFLISSNTLTCLLSSLSGLIKFLLIFF